MGKNNYNKLVWMLVLSFIIMYGVMFLNVTELDHIYFSSTRTYMSLLMISPMAVVMLVMMPAMYKNRKLNTIIIVLSVVVFSTALTFLRFQIPIGDEQYMKAMIPHHSSAILTSQNAAISDPEVKKLAEDIIKTQEREITQMKAMLERLEGNKRP